MPEGHTLHALARDLDRAFAGTRPEATSPQGRFAAGAELLRGNPEWLQRELARALARELGGEVVSADSRQVYKRLDAATAKRYTPSGISRKPCSW